ncbi:50S ribosomal protein L30 [Salinibius halmophilus]|uniref:50S ribosomal protein L30 n=1 Tax=Salinibius halmophilus TaxID=1853216 RepID=UPI000E65ECF5|nr:50S ribosomal protein L30 [Salinibius halmophilus]
MANKTLKVELFRSPIATQPKHKLCVKGLGLRKIGQVRELEDTPSVRGMINKVSYMVRVVGE